jgi:hypothetical protein
LFQWFQFPDTGPSWEVEAHVTAANLVNRFWENVGVTREEFDGKEIKPSAEFIG